MMATNGNLYEQDDQQELKWQKKVRCKRRSGSIFSKNAKDEIGEEGTPKLQITVLLNYRFTRKNGDEIILTNFTHLPIYSLVIR